MSYVNRPDRWVILEIKTEIETLYKVLCGWNGGYAGADEWRLNSGIVRYEIKDRGRVVEFHGHSGSIYECRIASEGFTSLMASVLSNLEAQCESRNDISVNYITFEEYVNEIGK